MARNACLLTAAAALVAAAPAAAVDHPAAIYRATISGTITAQWTYEFPDAVEGDCFVSHDDTGTRTIKFRSSSPTPFLVKKGRLVRRDIVNVAGTTTTTGSELRTTTCNGVDQSAHLDCVFSRRPFARARVGLTTRPQSVLLGPVRGVFAGEESGCPATPPAGELGRLPGLGDIQVSLRRVLRSARARIPGGREQTLVLGGNGDGSLTWTMDWTLTLTRARS